MEVHKGGSKLRKATVNETRKEETKKQGGEMKDIKGAEKRQRKREATEKKRRTRER